MLRKQYAPRGGVEAAVSHCAPSITFSLKFKALEVRQVRFPRHCEIKVQKCQFGPDPCAALRPDIAALVLARSPLLIDAELVACPDLGRKFRG
jgi:hypothetical protein